MELEYIYSLPIKELVRQANITLSPDLPQILQTRRIQRFVDHNHYPLGVIRDNDLHHVYRLLALAPNARVARIAEIHDLVELSSNGPDMTILHKRLNPTHAEEVRQREEAYAESNFSPSDLALYRAYNFAGDYLKGRHKNIIDLDSDALILKVLDAVDGHLIFHRSLSRWTMHPSFKYQNLPRDKALTHGLETNRDYVVRLQDLWHSSESPNQKSTVEYCIGMIADATDLVHQYWQNGNYIPLLIGKFFSKYDRYSVVP